MTRKIIYESNTLAILLAVDFPWLEANKFPDLFSQISGKSFIKKKTNLLLPTVIEQKKFFKKLSILLSSIEIFILPISKFPNKKNYSLDIHKRNAINMDSEREPP